MNILTDEEMKQIHADTFGKGVQLFARAIEAAVLSKLAEQAGEHPDAWRIRFRSPDTPDGFSTTHYHGTNAIADYRQIDPSAVSERLYTESQLIAERQRTAEACAKAVFEQAKYFGYNVHAEAVRDAALNNWSEYL